MASSPRSWLEGASAFLCGSHHDRVHHDDKDVSMDTLSKPYDSLPTTRPGAVVGSTSLQNQSDNVPSLNDQLQYEKETQTRDVCIVGLFLIYMVAICFIILGIIAGSNLFFSDGLLQMILGNSTQKDFLALAANVAVTICTEILGLIHATSLKWALYREGRLGFNANLRLFSFARRSGPNSRLTNALFLSALTLCYASSSAILIQTANPSCLLNEQYQPGGSGSTSDDQPVGAAIITISRSGSLCLGVSLLILCFICTWSIRTTKILTWSTDPLTVLAAAQSNGYVVHRERRCLRSVHDRALGSAPARPSGTHKPAYTAHKDVPMVLGGISIVLILLLVWFVAVTMTVGLGCSRSLLPVLSPCGNLVERKQAFELPCNTSYILLDFFPDVSTIDSFASGSGRVDAAVSTRQDRGIICQILFTVLIQAFITTGLHCAELETQLFRDEVTWRKLASRKGATTTKNSLLRVSASWHSLVLLVLKPLIQWLYGLAMTISFDGLAMLAPQLLYLAVAWAILLLFVCCVSFLRPKGFLPATYGHLQTMADIVDEWSAEMYWGEKGEIDQVLHAGTFHKPLHSIRVDALYM